MLLTQALKYVPKLKDINPLYNNFFLSLIVGVVRIFVIGDYTWQAIVLGILNIFVIMFAAAGGYENNQISTADWTSQLEPQGVVFLPCSGLREGTTVNYVNGCGRYWSSTYVEKARSLFFHQGDVRADGADYHSGFAVRLVQDVK